jgi:hypothetical protein
MPGQDIAEAQRIVFGEVPDLPYLPELPGRGAGADLIGRGGALLAGLPIELYAGRWRTAARAGRDLRAALDLLERDLDTLTEQADRYTGPLKIQAAGPWTLAASLDLPVGGRVLRDPGAVRDLTESLAEGLRAHVADVRGRVPGAEVILQLDEPWLPAVLAARVPTESGLATLRAVAPAVARTGLASVIDAAGVPVVVHCCAPDVPLDLLRAAGAAAVAIDLALVSDLDPLGELIDAGLGVFAGAVDTRAWSAARPPSPAEVADVVLGLWRKLGFPTSQLDQVVVTPACGLAGAAEAQPILAACRDAGRRIAEAAGRA